MSADLDILLADYQSVREDDRGISSRQSALASVFVALLAGLFAILVGDCRFRGAVMNAAKQAGSCYELPDPVYVMAPTLPFAVLCYIVMLGMQVTIKSFYMRAIENELRDHQAELRAIPGVLAGSATELMLTVISPRRGRRSYFVMLLFLTLSFAVALGGWVVFVALRLSAPAMITMFAVYGPLLMLLLQQGILANIGGRRLLRGAANHLRNSSNYPRTDLVQEPSRPSRTGDRSLWSYLLLPRPLDTVKWVFIPIAYLVGAVITSHGPSAPESLGAALGWLVFEYLIYQSRYQWNDIRGLADDQVHPAHRERGRLPVARQGPRRSVALSVFVIVARATLAVVVAFTVVPPPVSTIILVSFIGVWVPAWLYEFLREGRTRPGARATAIWLVVGVGYAVRASIGLALAGVVPSGPTSGTFFLFAGAAWAFGIVFVTMTWVLEATGHCSSRDGCVLGCPAELTGKPHLARLLRFTPLSLLPIASADGSASSLRVLAGRAPVVTPWNAALIAAVACGIAACVPPGQHLLLGATGVLAVAAVVLLPSVLFRWVITSGAIAVLGTTAALTDGWRVAVTVAGVTGLFLGVYCVFRQSSYDDLRYSLVRMSAGLVSLGRSVAKLGIWVLVLLLGKRTWAFVSRSDDRGRPIP
ncbi:hypothetical protein [Amycolatopsis sp. CA-230715]|uniref:hypothetical protein n=1 Tax=Amycolatopsis sp. CA-230715 TaxID=2745196 RepID=UPI001C012189|nr:hypothetical protein [Amycolatopsis sp. CA-230715]